MLFDRDDFALFDLPRRFALDQGDLDACRRRLQASVHPDRFVGEGAAAQRVAMQWAIRVNEAYARLKDPLKRAGYLCELAGAAVDAEDNTAMPAEFLVQQMEWREALDEAKTSDTIAAIGREVDERRRRAYAALAEAIDESADFLAAARQVRALMFLERFAEDVGFRLESMEG